jgi:hypothetical protein
MKLNEAALEVARQQVGEAEKRVQLQAARLANATRCNLDTTQLKFTLGVREAVLRLMREDLAYLQRQQQ